jgi:hypothetical protein
MNKTKYFNTFIFLSTVARTLFDCFITIILYKKGLGIDNILFYLVLNYSLSFILNVPLFYISLKISFKWLMIITSFLIGIAYYFLLLRDLNLITLLLFTIFHVISTNVYWVSRHFYALEILPKEDLADEVGNIIIISNIAMIPVSYFGALMINNVNKSIMLIVLVILFAISIIPLFYIKERQVNFKSSIIGGIKRILIHMPRTSLLFYIFAQFRIICHYFFPLYIFLYVKNNCEYIGIFNIVAGIASMVFVYFFSRKMDKEKKDYLVLSGFLGAIVFFLKLTIVDTTLMIGIAIAQGFTEKMYELSYNRNMYALGHHYNGALYATTIEWFQNLIRVFITFFFAIFFFDLKSFLLVSSFMLVITGLIGFDDGEGGY